MQVEQTVQVSLALPFLGPFDYLIPPHLANQVNVGSTVWVPFGPQQKRGWVIGFKEAGETKKLRSLLGVLDSQPLFWPNQLTFLNWAAAYYLCQPAEIYEAAVPVGLKGNAHEVFCWAEAPKDLPAEQSTFLHSRIDQPTVPTDPTLTPEEQTWLKTAEQQGWLTRTFHQERPPLEQEQLYQRTEKPLQPRKGSKKARLIELFEPKKRLSLAEIKETLPAPKAVLNQLVELGILKLESSCPPKTILDRAFLSLNQEQTQVFQELKKHLNQFAAFLLKGVTGSGKTEVYLHLAREVLNQNKQVLVLLPEIALTEQLIKRFSTRFGHRIAVLHSQMSPKKRTQQWLKIKAGQADVVIGARSAIFAPLDNLGLIVVDEEHDHSYKQQESPFYNARDLSLKLGQQHQAIVLLGTATPSIESYYHCKTEKYQLLELKKRAVGSAPPTLGVINLKESARIKGVFYLSQQLYTQLKINLEQGHGAILFLNRRGFAACLTCKSCETPLLCPNCDIALTWHKATSRLECHHCGFQGRYPSCCAACGEKSFSIEGIGTQRVERDLKLLFPKARFLRIDRDTMGKRTAFAQAVQQIENQEVDFVIGTQMIAKGHDFPNIGLVAILFADMSLNIPDIRSSERSYQLFAQVSGRAGRKEGLKAEAWLQTYNPDHFAVTTAINQDYPSFFQEEIQGREALNMPPFSRLIQIRISDPSAQKAKVAALKLGQLFSVYQEKLGFELLGPVQAPIPKINNRYYWHLLLQSRRPTQLKVLVKQLVTDKKTYHLKGSGRVTVDVDPYLFL